MDGDVEPGLVLQRVEGCADLLHRLIAAVEGRAQDGHHADRVLIALRDRFLGAKVKAVALHRHHAGLDVPVAAELLPAHLHVGAHDEVRAIGRLAGVAAALAPAPLERHPAEHARLAGAGRRASGRLLVLGRGPEVGEHVDAVGLDPGRLRILVLVDHVLVGRLGHQLRRARRHPGGDESGQVQPRCPSSSSSLEMSSYAASMPTPVSGCARIGSVTSPSALGRGRQAAGRVLASEGHAVLVVFRGRR